MSNSGSDRLVSMTVLALTVISIAGIVGGVIVAYLGSSVGAVIAVVTGAVGGIVAITIKVVERNGSNRT